MPSWKLWSTSRVVTGTNAALGTKSFSRIDASAGGEVAQWGSDGAPRVSSATQPSRSQSTRKGASAVRPHGSRAARAESRVSDGALRSGATCIGAPCQMTA
ncbi:MAG TPA: hypothetical protein DEF51_42920 [Myxococcales bacterium]|nr:hypothetical protein [Myxococcales bacterium]